MRKFRLFIATCVLAVASLGLVSCELTVQDVEKTTKEIIVEEYEKEVNDIKIQVTEYRIEESGQTEYSAKFQYEDVEYILIGVIEKEEFEKILENLHFF